MIKRKWEEITREERFFTSVLFHDILKDEKPLLNILQEKLWLPPDTNIIDVGYEVCFFRDASRENLIKERQQQLEKQTFDLVLWLSDQRAIIIEAKAQQCFHTKQLRAVHKSLELIPKLVVPGYPITQVSLVGLCSSKYTMKIGTIKQFHAVIKWKEIARLYPEHKVIYERADNIYNH